MTVRWAVGPDESALMRALGVDGWAHLCPVCGSVAHGRPAAAAYDGVSIARGGDLVAVVVSDDGPVGIDLERAGASAPGGVVAHPSESADPLRLWVRKEALLKATGLGLTVAPATFWIDDAGRPSPIAGYDGPPLVVHDLDVPGHVAALAIVSGLSPGPAVPRS